MNIYTSDCSTIVCLRILNSYLYLDLYNIYIADVKVSLEGRCLELLQYVCTFQIVSLPFSSKAQQPWKISARKTAWIQHPVQDATHRYLRQSAEDDKQDALSGSLINSLLNSFCQNFTGFSKRSCNTLRICLES